MNDPVRLDRQRPFAAIHGDSLASNYQGGHYFDSNDCLIAPEQASKPGANGSFTNQVDARVKEALAEENSKKPLTLNDDTNPHTNSPEDVAAARKRAAARNRGPAEAPKEEKAVLVADIDPQQARRTELRQFNVHQLRDMVKELGLVPATGRGSVNANIKILLDNTE